MVRQIIISITLIVVATLCYYIPTYFASSKGIDMSGVPIEYYNHHIWRTSGAFLLTAIYAFCFFIFVPERLLVLKIISCHLFLMETYSFISHVANMFFIVEGYSVNQIVLTLGIFAASLSFFSYRAFKNPESDTFHPGKTYVIRFMPRDITGFLNYIWDHTGHKAIYQGGYIYRFKRDRGVIRETARSSFLKRSDISFKELKTARGIERVVGKRFNLFFYNCNHMIKDAQR
jgi:hypothetical protein